MQYKEVYENLFDTTSTHLAHCISSDYALGAGIAVEFNKRYRMRSKLEQIGTHKYPDCIEIDNVFNLVTKKRYYDKPTLQSLKATLVMMRDMAIAENVKEISMPKIGAGLDRLPWMYVSEAIKDVFKDTDISIIVYIYNLRH